MKKEIWRTIKGFPSNIEVSNTGIVRETITGEDPIIKPVSKSGKYYKVSISGKQYPVHRLVAKSFIKNYSEDCLVIHIDGDNENNDASNLMCESKNDIMKSVAKMKGYRGRYIRVKQTGKVFATVSSISYLYRIPRECIEYALENDCSCFGYEFETVDIEGDAIHIGRSDVIDLSKELTSIEEYDNYLKSLI